MSFNPVSCSWLPEEWKLFSEPWQHQLLDHPEKLGVLSVIFWDSSPLTPCQLLFFELSTSLFKKAWILQQVNSRKKKKNVREYCSKFKNTWDITTKCNVGVVFVSWFKQTDSKKTFGGHSEKTGYVQRIRWQQRIVAYYVRHDDCVVVRQENVHILKR